MTELVIAISLFALLAIGVMALALPRPIFPGPQARRIKLRQRFGPEYERALRDYGSVSLAERELRNRAKRIANLHIRDLDDADRGRFVASWQALQARFIDDPRTAVQQADELITAVMAARGYPVADFEQRVADLSVEHANVVQHYRAAQALVEANREGRADTEEFRQAFVHQRALFAELLGETQGAQTRHLQEVRA